MNELKRNGKRTREQLTFSDTYLVLDNLRNYDFDLVSFYVTFNQYIDRRNYEGKTENSLIFANNEALFKAFNISRNRFYRLLELSYECGLIDIEKGDSNRNIYILNDAVPLEPLKKIRDWKHKNKNAGQKDGEKIIDQKATEASDNKEKIKELKAGKKEGNSKGYRKKSYPKKGQPNLVQPVVPKQDNPLSQNGTNSYPEKGQPSNIDCSDDFNVSSSVKSSPNNSNDLIDLSFNNQSISQSINTNNIEKKADRQTDISKKSMNNYRKIINNCELHCIDKEYRNAVIYAIRLLFLDIENKKRIKIGDNIIPVEIVKDDINKINFFVIEHAVNKFKEASREKEIRNTVAYLKVCIYNSIHEMDLDIDSELRYKGLI